MVTLAADEPALDQHDTVDYCVGQHLVLLEGLSVGLQVGPQAGLQLQLPGRLRVRMQAGG